MSKILDIKTDFINRNKAFLILDNGDVLTIDAARVAGMKRGDTVIFSITAIPSRTQEMTFGSLLEQANRLVNGGSDMPKNIGTTLTIRRPTSFSALPPVAAEAIADKMIDNVATKFKDGFELQSEEPKPAVENIMDITARMCGRAK